MKNKYSIYLVSYNKLRMKKKEKELSGNDRLQLKKEENDGIR